MIIVFHLRYINSNSCLLQNIHLSDYVLLVDVNDIYKVFET